MVMVTLLRTTGLSHYFLIFSYPAHLDKWMLLPRREQPLGPLSLFEGFRDQYLDQPVIHSEQRHTLSVIGSGWANGPLWCQLN